MYYEKVIEHVASLVMDMASQLETNPFGVPAGISAHHIHLTKEAVSILFGKGHSLTFFKKLSQPGQYAAEEQVMVIGPSGSSLKLRILGPERSACQVEITYSDARILGVEPLIRASGDIKGTPGILLVGPKGEITLAEGVIIAERHVHMTPADAKWFGVIDGQQVKITVTGPKAGVMEKVSVRVDESYRLDFHIDTDDANAFMLRQGEIVRLEK
jgi:putative phosphotransacetylase